jgi:hypothetical protein
LTDFVAGWQQIDPESRRTRRIGGFSGWNGAARSGLKIFKSGWHAIDLESRYTKQVGRFRAGTALHALGRTFPEPVGTKSIWNWAISIWNRAI